MADSVAPADLWAYEPPISLWSLVENYVHPHEREEVKNMLGASLVEQSLELHDEVNLLLDIWREYREETMEQAQNRPSALPEPPAARERLKQEICFFVESLRERAEREGRDPDRALQSHNAKVIDYALERPGSAGFSRPSTAMSSRDGRETPLTRRSTPSSDRMSLRSSLSEEVDSMRDKLNYLKMEEVVQHLRETMEEEVNQLLGDILFLQSCLDDEATYRSESSTGSACEPTLTDLREERSKLEKDLFTADPVASSPSTKSIRKQSGGLVPNSAGKMRPISQQSLKPTHNNSPKRPVPIKASHDIASPALHESSGNKTRESNSAQLTKVRGRSGCKVQGPDGLNNSPTRAEIEAMTPTHITIRTAKGAVPRSANLVKVGSIPATSVQHNGDIDGMGTAHTPSPPSAAKSRTRPSSANRFRNMVLNCRDS